jgi:hypothetical protein
MAGCAITAFNRVERGDDRRLNVVNAPSPASLGARPAFSEKFAVQDNSTLSVVLPSCAKMFKILAAEKLVVGAAFSSSAC